jgi:hypothetical protein
MKSIVMVGDQIMANGNIGEWKLLKVWECNKCKSLIKDARKVYDHVCSEKEEEDKLLALRKIIDDRDILLEERDKFIDDQKIKICSLDKRIEGLEHFIKELNTAIDGYNKTVVMKDKIIEDQRTTIEGNKKLIEDSTRAIEEQKISIENHEKTIEEQKISIEDHEKIIENQKNRGKVVEKVVYLEKGSPNNGNDKLINGINVDILQKDYHIKDSKDIGYREEIEIEIFERGKGKEKVIIKNGKVIKKPDDIIIIGKNMPEGFIVKGIYRN